MPVVIAGCFSGAEKSCTKTEEYHGSEQVAGMQVPDDLDEPDRSGALVIPGEPVSETARPPDGTCLERPPDYFDRKL